MLCNNCGDKLLEEGELINVNVICSPENSRTNETKEEKLKVCPDCYGHIIKYPQDDNGNYKVGADFKTYYIKIKKLITKKNEKETLTPLITIKGKTKKELVQPTLFSFMKPKTKLKLSVLNSTTLTNKIIKNNPRRF